MTSMGHHGETATGPALREYLAQHPLFGGDEALAGEAELCTELIQLGFDDVLIGTGRSDADLYLLFSGAVDVIVDGKEVTQRQKGQTVGELELVSSGLKRVATVVARDKTIVGRIAEEDFTALAERHPQLWRNVAAILVQRVMELSPRQ